MGKDETSSTSSRDEEKAGNESEDVPCCVPPKHVLWMEHAEQLQERNRNDEAAAKTSAKESSKPVGG
jgi:hypothetical protein